jgi:predicted N-acetyltransferase YhbS
MPLRIRAMTSADVPAAQRLREQAGWNQTDADWARLLAWEPAGCWVAERYGQIVASTTVTTYRTRIAWIGMVLVDEAHRGRGIGRRMLDHAHEYLHVRGVDTVALDATPAGIPLYERLGYRARHGLERWRGVVADGPEPAIDAARVGVRPMTHADLAAVAAYDARAFGTDRAHVLRALFEGHPDDCVIAARNDDVVGYALSRPGARARHLGPLVADDAGVAARLAWAALRHARGAEALMDVVAANAAAVALAGRLGLAPVRPFTRMTRGAPPPRPDLRTLYTSAGPEIG